MDQSHGALLHLWYFVFYFRFSFILTSPTSLLTSLKCCDIIDIFTFLLFFPTQFHQNRSFHHGNQIPTKKLAKHDQWRFPTGPLSFNPGMTSPVAHKSSMKIFYCVNLHSHTFKTKQKQTRPRVTPKSCFD